MNKSKIEWTDQTWNPVTGCTPISEGCQNCWAKRMSARLGGRFGYPPDEPFKVTFHPDKLDEPMHWRKPQKVFVCSMGDLFHEDVTGKQINEVWNVAMNNRRHTFMFLTKRPDRLQQWTKIAAAAKGWPIEDIWPDWMWLGVTAENQARADERIPILLQIPATVRFVSCEPLLSAIDLSKWIGYNPIHEQSNERKNRISSCTERGDRDRFSGPDMESGKARMGSVEEVCLPEKMQKSTGRTPYTTGVSTDQSDVRQETDTSRRTPAGVLPLFRPNTKGDDNQSQEWDKGRQQSRQYRTGNLCRADETCNRRAGPSFLDESAERRGQPPSEINQRGYPRNIRSSGADTIGDENTSWEENIGACKEIQRGIPVHLGCSKGPSLGITWCIAGPETGPRARPCKREWVADLYEQCRAAGVPFFDKRDVLGKGIREWPEVSRV